ncbi:hypothetical protein CROQUDRAFT_98771 [Cronartium quercuum f. sp. fusiforme G11]|uniref:Uncharacterized protein n=1 Tax=Cronartium quercuum f. sp. fusiforme G11 TaxID=708437 RepID=A0A9P6T6X1_9BASI|nr:hypothetical protein CROQUDRAFT_98771 [Cronartium quercuum f. sp. fusiforme G11]
MPSKKTSNSDEEPSGKDHITWTPEKDRRTDLNRVVGLMNGNYIVVRKMVGAGFKPATRSNGSGPNIFWGHDLHADAHLDVYLLFNACTQGWASPGRPRPLPRAFKASVLKPWPLGAPREAPEDLHLKEADSSGFWS